MFWSFTNPLLAVNIMPCQMEKILLWVTLSDGTLQSTSSENLEESVKHILFEICVMLTLINADSPEKWI